MSKTELIMKQVSESRPLTDMQEVKKLLSQTLLTLEGLSLMIQQVLRNQERPQ